MSEVERLREVERQERERNRKTVSDALDMFGTPGWKNFVDTIVGWAESVTIDSATNAREFYEAKGRIRAYRAVLAFEEEIRAWQRELEDEDEDESE